MTGVWTVAPEWEAILGQGFPQKEPEALYAEAEPVPGGRGTTRRIRRAGRTFLLKRESRGGLTGRFLPDLYLRRSPFRSEWAAARRAAEAGLAPPLAARAFVRRGPLLAVFTLSEEIPHVRSLAEVLSQDGAAPELLRRCGKAVAALHRAGLVHGDLNAGNLLLLPDGPILFVDFRHSRVLRGLPPPFLRGRNLRRLERSLRKVSLRAGRYLPPEALAALRQGYAEGWEAVEGEAPGPGGG
jgi:3-deoxy-D-manno-octulosonic acid kinase